MGHFSSGFQPGHVDSRDQWSMQGIRDEDFSAEDPTSGLPGPLMCLVGERKAQTGQQHRSRMEQVDAVLGAAGSPVAQIGQQAPRTPVSSGR